MHFAVPNPLFDEIFTPFVNLTPLLVLFAHLFVVLMVSLVKSRFQFVKWMPPTVNLGPSFVVLPALFVDSPRPFVISDPPFVKMITPFVKLTLPVANSSVS